MKKKMLNIIDQLEKGEITYEQARQQVLDLFVVIGSKPKTKPKKTGESFFQGWDKVIKNIKL
jgi:polyhydroxyalkanoate synthesis regulator phasin